MIQVEMSAAQFAAKAEELRESFGIPIVGKVGTISRQGVTAAYTHHNDTLTVHIVDKPAFISRTYCERRLEEWLVGAEEQPQIAAAGQEE